MLSMDKGRAARPFLLLAGLISALALGCSTFEDETTIIDLRLLGIQAEPTEIIIDQEALKTRTEPFVSDLKALVVDPKGAGRPISYTALACPREIDAVTAPTGRNGVVCQPNVPGQPPTSLDLTPNGPVTTPGTDPGPKHEIPIAFSVPPELVRLALSVDPRAMIDGFQLPIVVQLELTAESVAQGRDRESITATKRVIFSQPLADRPGQPPNQNPQITRVEAYPMRDATGARVNPLDLPPDPAPAPFPYEVRLGASLYIEPRDIEAQQEAYSTLVETRDVPPQLSIKDVPAETLRFGFFTTAGSFAPPETSTASTPIFDPTSREHLESKYTAPTTMPDDPLVPIYILIRDERGGASWTTRALRLVP